MKHIIIILALAISMASCTEQRLIKEYSAIYTYKVYDDVTYRIHFTDSIEVSDCSITFVDHIGEKITIANGQYKYQTLKNP